MINTTLCYIEQDGKYLLLHRVKKKNDINKDKWIGIGGKFEEGESPEDCIVRETLEETGLTIEPVYKGIVTFISDGMDETDGSTEDEIRRSDPESQPGRAAPAVHRAERGYEPDRSAAGTA